MGYAQGLADRITELEQQLADERDRVALVAQGVEHYSGCPNHFAGNRQDPECCRCRVEKAVASLALAQADLTQALDVLSDVVGQACQAIVQEEGIDLDSCALSAYRDGIRFLAAAGRVEIVHQVGRRVLAKWVRREVEG